MTGSFKCSLKQELNYSQIQTWFMLRQDCAPRGQLGILECQICHFRLCNQKSRRVWCRQNESISAGVWHRDVNNPKPDGMELLFNECCFSVFVFSGSVSPSLQPTSSRVARTLGLFGMASWLAQTSASGWLCRLNASQDILWLEKLRSRACTESAGTGITHSRDVKVTQKGVTNLFSFIIF